MGLRSDASVMERGTALLVFTGLDWRETSLQWLMVCHQRRGSAKLHDLSVGQRSSLVIDLSLWSCIERGPFPYHGLVEQGGYSSTIKDTWVQSCAIVPVWVQHHYLQGNWRRGHRVILGHVDGQFWTLITSRNASLRGYGSAEVSRPVHLYRCLYVLRPKAEGLL